MIINNTAELKKYISVNDKFAFDNFSPYINKAINAYTKKYVGNLHDFLEDIESTENETIKNEAREHLASAIANFSMFLYLPYFMVQMDSSGMSIAVNENRKTVEWWQAADIKRELLRSGHQSMDLLLTILEKNPEIFTNYHENYSSINNELLVKNADEFNKYYTIYSSRQTYLALIPTLKKVEIQLLKNFITKEFIEELKQDVSEDEDLKQIKEYIQHAIVLTTISKIYFEGFFHFDASGVKIKFDILPNEKVQAVDYGKQAEQLQRGINSLINDATQFILLAKEIIAEEYPEKLITTTSPTVSTIGTGGIIGI